MRCTAFKLSVLIWLGRVLFSTALAADGNGVVLTNIGQIQALSPEQVDGKPVRFEAVVTLYFPQRSELWVQDKYDGLPLSIDKNEFLVELGDRVRVTGRVRLEEGSALVSPDEVVVLEKNKSPEPLVRTAQQLDTFADENRWVQTEGHVLDVSERPTRSRLGRWVLELESGTNRFRLELPQGKSNDVVSLKDAVIRAHGVCVKQALPYGEKVQPLLLAQDLSNLTVLQPGRPELLIRPDRIPVQSIASLTSGEFPTKNSVQARVQGIVLGVRPGEHIVIRDDTGTIMAETPMTPAVNLQEMVDVWGTPVKDGVRVHLYDATVRSVNRTILPSEEEIVPAPDKPAQLPLLTKAREVRDLPLEKAVWQYPVRLRGVVTFYHGFRRKFYVQDDTTGIFIRAQRTQPELHAGDVVEIAGVTTAGGFTPVVISTNVIVSGTAPLPQARQATLFQLDTGQFDSLWVEVRGVVRSLSYEHGLLQLKLNDSQGTLTVDIPTTSEPTNLLDAVVRVRGVGATEHDRRQITGVAVWSPSLAYVNIEEPGVTDPFSLPTRSIESLSQSHPRSLLPRRVKVEGVVTFCQSGQFFFIQDTAQATVAGTPAGIQVFTPDADTVKPGDRVSVVGYPSPGDYNDVLREVVFRVQSHGTVPDARPLAVKHALNPALDGVWIQMDAHLLNRNRLGGKLVLTLQIPNWVFEASCPSPDRYSETLQVGSLLHLTGIYRIRVDDARLPVSFQLLMPSPESIRVLERPTWWTFVHAMTVVGVMALIAAAAAFWIFSLRRQVGEQTRRLRERLEREAALEQRFRDIFENANDIIFTHDLEGRITSINPAGLRMLGYTAEEVGGLTIDQLIAPEDRDRARHMRETALSNGEVATYDLKFITKVGQRRMVEVSKRASYKDGNRLGVQGIARDITDRKRAEEALRESQLLYHSFVEQLPSPVFRKDSEGRYVMVNSQFCKLKGMKAEEFLGKKPVDAARSELAKQGEEGHAAKYTAQGEEVHELIMRTGKVVESEEEYPGANGEKQFMHVVRMPVFGPDGKIIGSQGIQFDITERKRAQAAMAEASALLEVLMESGVDVIYFKDLQSRFVRFSSAFQRLFNVPDANLIKGKTDFDFFTEEHARPAFEDEQEIIRTGKPILGKLEKETFPNGRVTWALTAKMPWRDKQGKIIGTFGISKDVTALKEAEAKLAYEQELFQTLLATIPDSLYFKDRASRFVQVSKSKVEGSLQTVRDIYRATHPADDQDEWPSYMAGVEPFAEWLIGKTDFDTYPEAYASSAYEEEQEIIRTGQPSVGKLIKGTLPGGKVIWRLSTKLPWRDKNGNIIGTFGVSKDVTAIREAEEKLESERELLRTLLDNIPDTIYFKDLKSRFVHVSKAKATKTLQRIPDLRARLVQQTSVSNSTAVRSETDLLVGLTDFDIFTEEHARPAFEDEQEIIRTGKPILGKLEKETHPDGQVTWSLTTKMPWRDKDGNIIGTFGISKDVSIIKEAEMKLAYERGLFHALLGTLPDAIYFKDCESRFVRLSKSKVEKARRVLIDRHRATHPPGEALPPHLADLEKCAEFLIGKSDFDLYPDELARQALAEEQEIIRTGQPLIGRIEKTSRPGDDKPGWYHTTKMLWRDEEGKIIGTFGVTRDVTAIKEAEEKLAYERELFRVLLDTLPDSIYFKDRECRFVRLSKSKIENTLPITRSLYLAKNPSEASKELPAHLASVEAFSEYLIGKTDFDTYEEKVARHFFEEEQEIIRTDKPVISKSEHMVKPDGSILWMLITKMPWRDVQGNIIGTFGVSRNITALKQAEAELEVAHRRLVDASRLAGMAEVASDVLHNVGNVLNSVGVSCNVITQKLQNYDFSNLAKIPQLLQTQKGRLDEFLTNDPQGRHVPEYLTALAQTLEDQRNAMLAEINQLSKHADHITQIIATQQNYAKVIGVEEMVDVAHLVDDALHINAAALDRHAVHVHREIETAPPILIDKHKVLQILVNLIRNAKYALDDSHRTDKVMTVRTRRNGDDHVEIEVSDNGVGIAPENLTRIFGHGFTTRRNGHGFGLHSGALTARSLGGALTVRSDGIGHGATFTLLLPLKPSHKGTT